MRRTGALCCILLTMAGCSSFTELTPVPPVAPQERGYVELKKENEDFVLEKETKYFIKFPAPERSDYVLILKLNNKSIASSHLTSVFDDGDTPATRIRDEAAASDSTSVYAVDTRVLTFFWVIDTVRADTKLSMRYRYLPRWRHTFEMRYEALHATFAENGVDRKTYNSIGPGFSFDGFDFTKERANIDARASAISGVRDELTKLGGIIPSEIAAGKDTAYLRYVALKDSVEEELRFQGDYASALNVFERLHTSRLSIGVFLESAPVFNDFLRQTSRYPRPMSEAARQLISARLPEVAPFYEAQVRSKNDIKRITFTPSMEQTGKLYAACGQSLPENFLSTTTFVEQFNREEAALQNANARLAGIDQLLQQSRPEALDTLYTVLITRAGAVRAAIPESQLGRLDPQGRFPCGAMLTAELAAARDKAAGLQDLYARAQSIAADISVAAYADAEDQLRRLSTSTEFTSVPAVQTRKAETVTYLESGLFARVKRETDQRMEAFVARNTMTIDNVPALYQDSSLVPVYRLTFSSSGPSTVAQRNGQIDQTITQIKYVRFPQTSVDAIYKDFLRNNASRGVEKARAIVEHGKMYRGTERQIKAIVEECDPTVAKWIVKPKDYRKVYALPVTSNRQGSNEYVIRYGLRIPSEAQFPVFDITLKLPADVAEKAAKEQWYKEITINKKPIKNEGRFRISAPRADNNYESLVSPVQMDKEGNNILEVRFMYPGFRVLEISAMAQVPIIRKN